MILFDLFTYIVSMIPESHNPGAVRRTAQKWQQVSQSYAGFESWTEVV